MTAVLNRQQLSCTVDPAAFKAAVSAAGKRVPSRPAIPILGCIRLDVTDDRMAVNASDQFVSLSATLAVDGRGDGSVAVSGRALAQLVDTLPNKPVQLVVEDDWLTLTCGTVKLGFPTLSVEDFPALPELPQAVGTIAVDVLGQALKRVACATRSDAEVPALVGMWIGLGATELTMMASDRYKAAKAVVGWTPSGGAPEAVVVAAHVLVDLAAVLPSHGEVSIHADEHLFGLSCDGLAVTVVQIATEYPTRAMTALFNVNVLRQVTVDAAEFAEHLNRANKVHEKTTPITLAFTDGEVRIGGTAADKTHAEAVMPCVLDGEPIQVLVNPEYLITAVRAAGTSQVVLQFATNVKSFLVVPDGDGAYQHLVMPIRKQ